MKRSKSLEQTIADGERILRVWEANKDFTLGEIKLADFKKMVGELHDARTRNEEQRRLLTESINDTDAKAVNVLSITTRALSGIRAVFGPDSSQYQEAGGTRSSDRKKATKKASSKKVTSSE